MSEVSLVTIKTRSGRWEREVSINDVLFSDILTPFIELDEQATEIVLSGATAEIIEEEWSSLENLLNDQVVPLRTITRISRILTLPDEWWLRVYTERGDPGYIDHLTLLARSNPISSPIESNLVYFIEENSSQLGSREAVMAVVYNAMLIHGEYRISFSSIDWEAALEVMERFGITPSITISNTLLTFAGRGDVNAPTIDPRVSFLWKDYRQIMYVLAIRSMTNIDFRLLGLNLDEVTRVYTSHQPFTNRICNIVPHFNRDVLVDLQQDTNVIISKTKGWTESMVIALGERIGRQGLVRLLIILLQSIAREGEDADPQWLRLASLIEDRIEE